jgi:REP element-mobilizing transposase RayT
MLDDYGFEKYENNEFPLAYLLTFRTYGTWLHGDQKHSVTRLGGNIYGTPDLAPNPKLKLAMEQELNHPAVLLSESQRKLVESAINEVCEHRKYILKALNVRTNHVHAVVSGQTKPERIVDTFKAYSTRRLRNEDQFEENIQVWSRGRSRRYLWKPKHVAFAIEYVLYGQGDVRFEIDDE